MKFLIKKNCKSYFNNLINKIFLILFICSIWVCFESLTSNVSGFSHDSNNIENEITNIDKPYAFLMTHLEELHVFKKFIRQDRKASFIIQDAKKQNDNIWHIIQSLIANNKYIISWQIDMSKDILPQFEMLAENINKKKQKNIFLSKTELKDIFKYFSECHYNVILILDKIDNTSYPKVEDLIIQSEGKNIDLVFLVKKEVEIFIKFPNLVKLQSKNWGHDLQSLTKSFLINVKSDFVDYISEQFVDEPYIATIAAQIVNRSYNMNLEQYIKLSNAAISSTSRAKNIINHSTKHLKRSSVDLLHRLALTGVLDFSVETAKMLLGKDPVSELLDLTQMNLIYCFYYDKSKSIYRIDPVVSKYVLLDERVSYSAVYSNLLDTIIEYQLNHEKHSLSQNFTKVLSKEYIFQKLLYNKKFSKIFFHKMHKIILATSLLNFYIDNRSYSAAEDIFNWLMLIKMEKKIYPRIFPLQILKESYFNYMISVGKYYFYVKKDLQLSKEYFQKSLDFIKNSQNKDFEERKMILESYLL
ncbi:MAG: hypothetical protein ISN64_03445 [Rickettsia sp.]|nr:hypothetical protein [Rickettsia sp.]